MPEHDVVVRWRVAPERAEIAAMRLWDEGATAVEVGDDGTVVASFPTNAAAEEVAAALGAGTERIAGDWRDAWRAHAEPMAVGDRLMVVPAWRPVPVAGGRLVVEIDPGDCFGSGSHASTRLALGLLAAGPVPTRVLDVGTGSGILAVTAALLGAISVTATDVDPAAVGTAMANAVRNGVAGRVSVSTDPVTQLPRDFDLALVNVTAGVHAELGSAVAAAVRPGGRLVLSGLLPGQWRHVAAAYGGCRPLEHHEVDGWAGVVLERT